MSCAHSKMTRLRDQYIAEQNLVIDSEFGFILTEILIHPAKLGQFSYHAKGHIVYKYSQELWDTAQ